MPPTDYNPFERNPKNHAYVRLPKREELNMTPAQFAALRSIRLLYGEIERGLSYFNTTECLVTLGRIDTLIATHFPDDWERIRAQRECAVIKMERPEDQEVAELFKEMAS
jgi:hypothetical protein